MSIGHKIVCWGDYAIPVPLNAAWLYQDKDGEWSVCFNQPISGNIYWFGGGIDYQIVTTTNVPPPEPGPWNEQIYWIGD